MTTAPAPVALENDPRNPCIGCGPEHPTGLHLAFVRQGDAVMTSLVASPYLQGWPGRLHSGILYLVMLEVANWTLYGILGRVGIPVRTSSLDAKRWVATGETLTFTGRLTRSDASEAHARIETADAHGVLVATLDRDYDLPRRASLLKRMGYDAVPAGLEGTLPE